MTNQPNWLRGPLLFAILLLFVLSPRKTSAQTTLQVAVSDSVNYAIGGYYEALPANYQSRPTKKFPLIIFIHGIGELGNGTTDLPKVLLHGLPKLINRGKFPDEFTVNGENFSFMVISPQFKKNYRDAAAVETLIDYCVKKYRVDESRIYLTGLSMGGGISWIYAGKQAGANRLAALLTVSGNTNMGTTGVDNMVAANLPVWATHNEFDNVVPSSYSVNWITALNSHVPAIKPKALLSIFPVSGHDAWTKTYDPLFKPEGINVYEWMLSHKRTTGTAPVVNSAPTVNAGADKAITLPTNSVFISGAATDADGSIASLKWTKTSGPTNFTISNATGASAQIEGLTAGIYVFRLSATDNSGAVSFDEATVTVTAAANLLPVASAGADKKITLPVNSVSLSGSGTDADGTIVAYNWTKVSGPDGPTVENPALPSTLLLNLLEGTYIFRLTVTDNSGGTSASDVQVSVMASPISLFVNAGKDTLIYKNQTRPDTAVLAGTAAAGVEVLWTKISGPGTVTFTAPNVAQTYAVGLQEGSYKFKLTANGLVSDTINVEIVDWQKKNLTPCRPGGGKSFTVTVNSGSAFYRPYINRDNVAGEKVMGGDTLYFKGGTYTGFEIGDFGGAPGCPVYIMPKDGPVIIKDGFFRVGTRDSNVVQHAILDGTVLRSKKIPYGFVMDNSHLAIGAVNYGNLSAGWVSNFTVKGYRSYNTGIFQIKMDAKKRAFGQYDKFIQKRIIITDNFINYSTTEGFYIGHTDSDGGQSGNPYGPPPRMDSVEISNNIVMNCGWDGIQLANARYGVIKNNFVYKTGLQNWDTQRAGILMGGNTTGLVDSNVLINSQGTGIQTFGYGKISVTGNVVDSVMSQDDIHDGTYQSFIRTGPEANTPQSVFNNGNLMSRISRDYIRVANNTKTMLPGTNNDNFFVHPTETIATNLISDNARGTSTNNKMVKSYPFKVEKIAFSSTGAAITISQGTTVQTFANGKQVAFWLIDRLRNPEAPNALPVANAGADAKITLPIDSVTLKGSATDKDGTIASYQWKMVSAPQGYLFTAAGTAIQKLTSLIEGSYLFELTVKDNKGGIGKDSVSVTVFAAPVPPNKAPTVTAENDITITLPTDSIQLSATAADEDGTIETIRWRQLSGAPSAVILDSTAKTTSVHALAEGTYAFVVLVRDNRNDIATDTILVTVNAAPPVVNSTPVAVAGKDQTITLPTDSVMLTGTGSDADGKIAMYNWKKLAGPAGFTIAHARSAQTLVTGLLEGVYAFEFSVTDDKGSVGLDTVQITVNAAPVVNAAPTVSAGNNTTITLPTNKTSLKGVASDVDGTIVSYNWSKIGGPVTYLITNSAAAETTIENLEEGTYTLTLTVTDDKGAKATDTMEIKVLAAPKQNSAPKANAGSNVQITLPQDSVILTGTGVDDDGTIVSYQWKKLEGAAGFVITTSNSAQTTVKSLQKGVYTFELTVTDNNGATGKDTTTVTVNAAARVNRAPKANAGKDTSIVLPQNSVEMVGTATDEDGTIQSYEWVKISGPTSGVLANSKSAKTKINGLTEGVYGYELRVKDNEGASAKDTVMVTVQMLTRPNLSLTVGADRVVNLPVDSVQLEATIADAGDLIVQYQWAQISGPATTVFSSKTRAKTGVSKLEQGTYVFGCTATDKWGNKYTDSVQIVTKAVAKSSLKLYPNPASHQVTIKIEANTKKAQTSLIVYNQRGIVVHAEVFERTQAAMTKQLDISSWLPGTYLVKVAVDINHTQTATLIKQ